jgi:tetratricopeptide (TPR) repeat protein
MKPLEPPDSHHLNAACGWLGLDNAREAAAELEKIAPVFQAHPDVLEVRWQIFAKEENWQAGLDLANELLRTAPGSPAGWIFRAYALRRIPGGGLKAAQQCLVEGRAKFPGEPIIAYNLACYACQLGELKETREWLKKACGLGSAPAIKDMALKDADLEPLWPEIREW